MTMGATNAPYAATADVQPSTGPACVRSKITPIERNVEPLPIPLAANSTTKSSMNTRKYCSGAAELYASSITWPTAIDATTITTEMICVTIEPPTLSEIQPPIGRTAAPTNGPIHAQARTAGALGLVIV